MEVCIAKEELEKALAKVNIAIANGFTDALAILKVYTGGECIDEFLVKYNGTVLKAHPTDGKQNWGRSEPEDYKCVNGECLTITG